MDTTDKEDKAIEQLGKRIKALRKKAGMTQRQVSDLMGIEEASFQRIERGATNPTFKTMYKLSQALDIDMKDLFESKSSF